MKRFPEVLFVCCLACSGLGQCAASGQSIQKVALDEALVVSVPVATNRVTTISFPGPIAAMDAASVTVDADVPGSFQLAHTAGAPFFSVRALTRGANANINIRWGRQTYVFELIESARPVLSLVMETKASGGTVHAGPRLSPTQLLALLDKAKTFPVLKTQQPDEVKNVEFVTFDQGRNLTDYGDFAVQIEEAYRFDAQDTLVFRLSMINRVDTAIRYHPDSLAIRVGTRVYHQSISDASGLIPPTAETTTYFAVTGSSDGARNELSLKNEFRVLVERLNAAPTPSDIQ